MDAKTKRGEVFTPEYLVNKMLDLLPVEVWTNKNLKWLEPSAGRGAFFKEVFKRLVDAGIDREYIIENMLYMVEIDVGNIKHLREYFGENANIIMGSFIKNGGNSQVDFNISFDIVVGNPPYQYEYPTSKRVCAIWNFFIYRSVELLKDGGFLVFVNPSGWRNHKGGYYKVFQLIQENNLMYLNINNYEKGKEVFNSATNFDYYLMRKEKTTTNITKINDIDNKDWEIDLNKWKIIPNGLYDVFDKLFNHKEECVELLQSGIIHRSHGNYECKYSDTPNDYPIICILKKGKTHNIKYSKINIGYFGIPKVIFSIGSAPPITDAEGKYSISSFASAIKDEVSNLEKIRGAMISEKFITLMKYLILTRSYLYNEKAIALLKKDFYNDFI
jgi:hypothetical protein